MDTVVFLVEEMMLNLAEVGFVGRNSFLCAASGGQIKILGYIDSIGPSLRFDRDYNQYTALILAAYFSDKETVKYLIEEIEMDINVTGQYGANVYFYA